MRSAKHDSLALYWDRLVRFCVSLNGGGDRYDLWKRVQPDTPPPAGWIEPAWMKKYKRPWSESRESHDKLFRNLLQQFVDTWLAADKDFTRWCQTNNRLFMDLRLGVFSWRSTIHPLGRASVRKLMLPLTGWAAKNEELAVACWHFAEFLENPLREQLGKCYRCRRYFLSKSKRRNKVYCGPRCGHATTAIKSTRKRRRQQREQTLKRVRTELRNLVPDTPKASQWKRYLARRAGVTNKWITRAVNKGELRLPAFLTQLRKNGRGVTVRVAHSTPRHD
jgi:hypothetical protein